MSQVELTEQELQRRENLSKLREMGIDPYPAALFPVNAYAEELKRDFEEGKSVCLAGRMMSQRIMGKASFALKAGKSWIKRQHHCLRSMPRAKFPVHRTGADTGL